MRKLQASPFITSSVGFPPKAGTWDFLQQAHQETTAATITAMIGDTYDPAVPYVLYGCGITSSLGTYTITAGAIFFGGEVFLSPASSTFVGGGDVLLCNIVTTQYTTNADPVLFTDAVNHNVHNIRQAGYAGGTGGTGTIGDASTFVYLNPRAIYNGSTSGNALTVLLNNTNYYKLSATSSADITITISTTGVQAGRKSTIHIVPDGSGNNLVFAGGGTNLIAGPSGANAAAEFIQVNIEYAGSGTYFISIVQQFT